LSFVKRFDHFPKLVLIGGCFSCASCEHGVLVAGQGQMANDQSRLIAKFGSHALYNRLVTGALGALQVAEELD